MARDIDKVMQTLRQLPPESQELVASLIEQLAEAKGVSLAAEYKAPAESIEAWVTKLRSERMSERTVKLYTYLAGQVLAKMPRPTKAEVREYLAKRLREASPSTVENERKALGSLFSFLYKEGLWPENPLEGVAHVGERWGEGERKCPSPEDVERVLEVGFARAQDKDKMRTVVIVLATTGLRITECISLKKDAIDFEKRELRVLGKGRKRRTVPLIELTAAQLAWYMQEHPSDSPFIFPGDTREGHAHISNVRKTLKRACLRAGIEPFSPHQLRHFYTTEMLKDGAKLEAVSRLLGHTSVGITADLYRHIRTEEMREEVEKHAPLNGNPKEAQE